MYNVHYAQKTEAFFGIVTEGLQKIYMLIWKKCAILLVTAEMPPTTAIKEPL